MPFALSLVITAASMAMATKITESNKPVPNIIKPVAVASYNRIGIPAPTKNANAKELAKPVNTLNQMVFRFRGWLTINSKNSALLYT